jgi:hypothetical protein
MDSKNIKDYLHFYLGCECIINWENPEYEENGKVRKLDSLRIYEMLTEYPEAICKPILRPLSDMTEEEAKQFYVSDGWGENLENIVVTDGGIDFTIARTSGYCIFSRLRPSSFLTLLSKGFDIFGLIDAGLAIDKTKITQ